MKLNKEQVINALTRALDAQIANEKMRDAEHRASLIESEKREVEYCTKRIAQSKEKLARLMNPKEKVERPWRTLHAENIEQMIRLAEMADGPITITGAFRNLVQYL